MECIEARALKSSFLSQMAMKTNSQVFYNDDVWCLAGINNVVGSDDFPVEDLLNLDFPEKECFLKEDEDEEEEEENSEKRDNSNNSSSNFSGGADEFDSLSAGELAVPVDDLENLEWLSQFVDDSTSGLSLLCPTGTFTAKTTNRVDPVSKPVQKAPNPFFTSRVPVKARSKRSRLNKRPWSLSSPPLKSLSTDYSSSTSSTTSVLSPFEFMNNPVFYTDLFSSTEKKPVLKKYKRKFKPDGETGLVSGRRCTHCQVQKTPQWRTGPLGPKTLCNACGVRFKSGRLHPEYRPACSPTFLQEVHSNSHRKVLEMRRKKEVEVVVEPGLTSFGELD